MQTTNTKKALNILLASLIAFSYILTSGILLFKPHVAKAATYTVTNTNDSGAGSLRQAIDDANTSVGVADTIAFNIAGAGVHTIQPTSALPAITDPVTIDGTTQSGWVANTAVAPNPFNGTMVIELDGQNAGGPNVNGLTFDTGSTGSTVKGMVINRYAFDGIGILTANNITIQGNYIGTSTDGLTDLGNGARGVGSASGYSSDNGVVGGLNPADRNLISGNDDGGGPTGNEGISICDLCSGWTVQGNYIGVDVSGLTAMPNENSGVGMVQGSINNIVGGTTTGATNVISGNGMGITTTTNATIQGNLIGTGYTGLTDVGNSGSGINILENTNIVGGSTAAARNIISGNTNDGISITSDNNTISGNYIGTNITGTSAIGNGNNGISDAGDNNTIGGTTGVTPGGSCTGACNLVSGNSTTQRAGISITTGSSGSIVKGNIVGLDVTGSAALPNYSGMVVFNSTNHTIGGTTPAERNVLSGNYAGIFIAAIGGTTNSVTFSGNYVGTNPSGQIVGGLGNTVGVFIVSGATNNMIGGTATGAGNLIAGNTGTGIVDMTFAGSSPTFNSFLQNSIYSNGFGIDLCADSAFHFACDTRVGVTPNDVGDVDLLENVLMNFPVISSVTSTNGQATITYDLDINDAEPSATGYRVDFYASDSADATGNGQGQTYIGSDTVSGDVTGRQATITLPVGVDGSKHISALTTMTDNSADGFGHTSEFSADIQATLVPSNITPTPTPSNNSSSSLAGTGQSQSKLKYVLFALMLITSGAIGIYLAKRKGKNKEWRPKL